MARPQQVAIVDRRFHKATSATKQTVGLGGPRGLPSPTGMTAATLENHAASAFTAETAILVSVSSVFFSSARV
jgi:hypothetical protein